MIRFERVSYRYPGQCRPALAGIDLTVDPGDFLVVTGPSGAGKSSLARAINGLIPHFHGGRFGGRLTVDGLDVTAHGTADLSTRVGFVAQDPETQTVMSRVEDEIAFGPENRGLERRAIRLRVEEALDLLGLSPLRSREIGTLSGGERQRVAIAAAMALRPAVLVLDEPTSQLDPWAAEEVLTVLERLNADLGTTIVLVEHRLERVLGWADRLVMLDRPGTVAADGPPREVVHALAVGPPLARLARGLGWEPTPLTVREARRVLAQFGPDPAALGAPPAREPRPGAPLVRLERVSFAYGDRLVLREVSVSFAAGQVTALMGRNGAGKTTLLKQVNGLLRPRSGCVEVLGRDIARVSTSDLARQVGYLPQHPGAMLFNDTVAAEIAFTLRAQGRPGDGAEALVRLGLETLAQRSPFDLSGGERQRAALAAVLVARPRVLLLDEPTRGMDYERKAGLARLLREEAERGAAIVLATHDVELVAQVADRVLVLAEGEVVADGPPRSVLPGSLTFAPATNRVLGGAWLLPEEVLERAATLRRAAADQRRGDPGTMTIA